MEAFGELLILFFGAQRDIVESCISVIVSCFWFVTLVLGPPLAVLWYLKRRYLDHITYNIHQLHEQENGRLLLRIRTVEMLPRSDLLPLN